MAEFEIEGIIYSTSTVIEADFDSIEQIGEEVEVEVDPDAWRQYADVIDAAQIEWLKKHPEYDYTNAVARYSRSSR